MPAPPPSSPPPTLRIIEGPPPKPPPPPSREIRASDIGKRAGSDPGLAPPAPASRRPGAVDTEELEPKAEPAKTAKDQMLDALENLATPEPSPPEVPEVKAPVAQKPKGKTAEAWERYETEKKRSAKLEEENQKLRHAIVPEQERETLVKRAAEAEKRRDELENEIRFVNYQKSSEFQDAYQKPYEQAWKDALEELAELPVNDPLTQQPRAVKTEDMLELLALSTPDALDRAEELFGKFAEQAMIHRKAIKDLDRKMQAAITDSRAKGAEREKQMQAVQKEQRTALEKTTGVLWNAAVEAIGKTPAAEYLKPMAIQDGKTPTEEESAWNKALEDSVALVKSGWALNPLAPELKNEQRADIVAKHAAIWNRAVAYGPMKLQIKRLRAEVASLKKSLSQFEESTPRISGSASGHKSAQQQNVRDSLMEALEKIAH